MLPPLRSMAAGLLLLVVLTACTGAAAAPSGVASLQSAAPGVETSAAPSASLDPEAAQLAFVQCMRDHGIDMPDPETAPGGGFTQRVEVGKDDAEKMQAAQQACDHFLDQAGGTRREIDPAQLDKLVAFAQCMREHGVDMPDPTVDGKGGIMFKSNAGSGDSKPNVTTNGIDPESETFKAAQDACGSILGTLEGEGPSFQGPDAAKP
jgi:hypothetical protein